MQFRTLNLSCMLFRINFGIHHFALHGIYTKSHSVYCNSNQFFFHGNLFRRNLLSTVANLSNVVDFDIGLPEIWFSASILRWCFLKNFLLQNFDIFVGEAQLFLHFQLTHINILTASIPVFKCLIYFFKSI